MTHLVKQEVESNGGSHPQFQDSQPVRLKRGTEGVIEEPTSHSTTANHP
ncbi:hypothetical protein [Limnospira platensis]